MRQRRAEADQIASRFTYGIAIAGGMERKMSKLDIGLTKEALKIVKKQAGLRTMSPEEVKIFTASILDTLSSRFGDSEGLGCGAKVVEPALAEQSGNAGDEIQTDSLTPSGMWTINQENVERSYNPQTDKVVCLECGKEVKNLTNNHLLQQHGLSRPDYIKKYKLPRDFHFTTESMRQLQSNSLKQLHLRRKNKQG